MPASFLEQHTSAVQDGTVPWTSASALCSPFSETSSSPSSDLRKYYELMRGLKLKGNRERRKIHLHGSLAAQGFTAGIVCTLHTKVLVSELQLYFAPKRNKPISVGHLSC